jgi:putative photosynthetic complex assembly protein 2
LRLHLRTAAFLTGWITGPRKTGHTPGCSRWRHAWQAVQVILWHELWLLLSLSLLVALTWQQPNQVGLWTFVVLWCMRASAKLNLFLGVRNLGLEFLPKHLSYLQHYFRKAPLNLLMPLSITVSTVVVVWLLHGAISAPAGSATAIGQLLVATMLAMGVLEHWMLVLPLNPSTLWRWALREGRQSPSASPLDTQGTGPAMGTNSSTAIGGLPGSGGTQLRIQHDEDLLHARSA